MKRNKVIEDFLEKEEANKINLLPCPFCGGSASYVYRPNPNSVNTGYAKVSCDTCNAVVGVSQRDFEDYIKELCVAKWNRRI